MIEKLVFSKAYIYKSVELGNNKIKWQMIKRLDVYPEELEKSSNYLLFYSPDFSLNMNIDKFTATFYIRDTYTNQELYKIPKDLMTYNKDIKDDSKNTIARFKWLDNETFKIVSPEGYEKIVDFAHNFKEIKYNVVPLFERCKTDWENYPYFFKQTELSKN